MTAISGTAGSVVYWDGSDDVVGELSEWSLDLSHAPVEVTAFGDGGDSRFVTNLNRATGSFAGNLDPTETGQAALRTKLLNGQSIRLFLYLDPDEFVEAVSGYVTGNSPALSVDGKAATSYDFAVSGVISAAPPLNYMLMEAGDTLLTEDDELIRIDATLQWGSG